MQEEAQRLFDVITTKRDRVLFRVAYIATAFGLLRLAYGAAEMPTCEPDA